MQISFPPPGTFGDPIESDSSSVVAGESHDLLDRAPRAPGS